MLFKNLERCQGIVGSHNCQQEAGGAPGWAWTREKRPLGTQPAATVSSPMGTASGGSWASGFGSFGAVGKHLTTPPSS